MAMGMQERPNRWDTVLEEMAKCGDKVGGLGMREFWPDSFLTPVWKITLSLNGVLGPRF